MAKNEQNIQYFKNFASHVWWGPLKHGALGHGLVGLCINPALVTAMSLVSSFFETRCILSAVILQKEYNKSKTNFGCHRWTCATQCITPHCQSSCTHRWMPTAQCDKQGMVVGLASWQQLWHWLTYCNTNTTVFWQDSQSPYWSHYSMPRLQMPEWYSAYVTLTTSCRA